jgi:acyl-CoA thioester hydrolase
VGTFYWPVRVYYEDTDGGGVVYYANHLKYMERARTEWLRELGCEQGELLRRERLVFVVRSAQIDYRRPARLDDRLQIGTRVEILRRTSLTFAQQVEHLPGKHIVCAAMVRVACVHADTWRPQPLPVLLLREIRGAS